MNTALQKNIHHSVMRGFTLVEMMVALSVFSIVMTVSVGTLLVMIDANAKSQALYSSMTNVSFALDSMAREIRTGYRYYCAVSPSGATLPDGTADCESSDPGDFLAFTRGKNGDRLAYRKNGSIIEQSQGGVWTPITSDRDIEIDTFELIVRNTSLVDGNQPTVDVFIKGTMNNGLEVETVFNVQTRIIQRRLDVI